MSRLARPEQLGPHLDASARAWASILDGADAAPLTVFGRLEALARSWAALQREVLAPFGLNYAELSTLGQLRTTHQRTCSPSELRGLVGQTSAGMTRILDKLEADRLVRRVAHADDGRRVEIRLTARGARLAEACHDALLGIESALLDALDKRTRDALTAGIDALLTAFADRRESDSG